MGIPAHPGPELLQPIIWPAFILELEIYAIDAICLGKLADQELICKSQTDLQPKGWQPTCIADSCISCRARNVGLLQAFQINFCSITEMNSESRYYSHRQSSTVLDYCVLFPTLGCWTEITWISYPSKAKLSEVLSPHQMSQVEENQNVRVMPETKCLSHS